jgi:mono/diheme cytochrome c family protein
MMADIAELVGHLHPALVHLPIGILLAGILLYWLSRREKWRGLRPAVSFIFLIGAAGALLSCITGYVLSGAEAYDKQLRSWHQWVAIATTVLAAAAYYFSRRPDQGKWVNGLSVLLLAGLFITGHLGGSLTHGADYFSKPLAELFGPPEKAAPVFKKPIPDIAEAVVYRDLVHPIFQSRCVSCHGEKKQKGDLRLDEPDGMLAGGKSGKAIVPGKPDLGELLKRLTLPLENRDHMPPKNKPQLTDQEIALLKWWVADSADFDKKVRMMSQPPFIRPVLLAIQQGTDTQAVKITDVPEKPVDPAPEQALSLLRSHGVVVLPVAANSHYLSANFYTAPLSDSSLLLLEQLAPQLAWLNLSGSTLSDKELQRIGKLTTLTKLYLNDTKITDSGLQYLKPLKNLQYLNLVHTDISPAGLAQLRGLGNLKNIYFYQTRVQSKDWPGLQQTFPHAQLDSGGYIVSTLESDTTVFKKKP